MSFTAQDVMTLRQRTGAGMMDCKKALAECDGDFDKAIDYLREKGIAKAAKKAGRIAAEGIVSALIKGNVGALVEVNCETDFVAKGDQYKSFVDSVAEYICDNDVADIDALVAAKADETIAATATIGEKIAIRRFAKYVSTDGIVESYIHMGGKVGVMLEIVGCTCNATKELAHDLALQIAAAKPEYVSADEVPADVLEHEKDILRAQAREEGKPEKIIEKMVEGRIKTFYEDNCLLNQKFVKDSSKTIADVVKEASQAMGKDLKVTKFVRYEMGEGLTKKSENLAEEVAAQVNAMKNN